MGNRIAGRHRAIRAAGLTVVALALVAACTSDPPQAGTLPPTVSTTTVQTTVTSPTPSSTPASTISAPSPASTTSAPSPASTKKPTTQPSESSTPPTLTSKSDPPPPPADERFVVTIPASIKGADRKTAEKAVEIYRHVQDLYDLSFRSPASRDWDSKMSKYLTGAEIRQWRSTLKTFRDNNLRQIGYTTTDGVVRSSSGSTVEIESCQNNGELDVVDQLGKSIVDKQPVRRAEWTVYVENIAPVGWQIRIIDRPKPAKRC